jgi:hypothetical protein
VVVIWPTAYVLSSLLEKSNWATSHKLKGIFQCVPFNIICFFLPRVSRKQFHHQKKKNNSLRCSIEGNIGVTRVYSRTHIIFMFHSSILDTAHKPNPMFYGSMTFYRIRYVKFLSRLYQKKKFLSRQIEGGDKLIFMSHDVLYD